MQLPNFLHLTTFARRLTVILALLLPVLLVLGSTPAAAQTTDQPASLVLGQPDFTSNTPAATASGMYSPYGVAVDPTTAKVFVADRNNNRVLRFADLASLSNGAPAEGVLGQPDFTSTTAATTASGMDYPTDVAVEPNGTLWVADQGNNRVLRFAAVASKSDGASAEGVLGQPDFTSHTSATTASGMDNPFGVAVDNSGTLWVADIFNSRVLRFDGAATKPNGASAEGVLGQPDFTSSAFATTTTGMTFPTGVTVGSSGTLWVADEGNSRVLRFDHAARKPNGAAANGVLGQPDFTSRTPVTTANGMYFPTGVTVDHYGTLWVADSTNNRVLRFDHAARKPNGAAANGVLGQPDFTSNGYATTANAMNHPAHVAQDPTGSLWVTDSWNNRVLLFATE